MKANVSRKLSEAIQASGELTLSNTEAIREEVNAVRMIGETTRENIEIVMRDTNSIRESGAATASNVQALGESLGTILPELQFQAQEDITRYDQLKRQELLEWLSTPNFPAQQSDLLSRKQRGTGQWFLDSTEYLSWLARPNGTLFCPGIPGAGKTIMATIAIDHLLKTKHNSLVGVAYAYCNYKKSGEKDYVSLFAAILKQLIQIRPALNEPLVFLHNKHADQGTRPSIEEILEILKGIVALLRTTYLIVDGLDEFRDHDGTCMRLISALRNLQLEGDVRLLATSRYHPEIVAGFSQDATLPI